LEPDSGFKRADTAEAVKAYGAVKAVCAEPRAESLTSLTCIDPNTEARRMSTSPVQSGIDMPEAASQDAGLVAIARKILVWCWNVYRYGTAFDPLRACAREMAA
jgi:hypothetical protein